MPPQKRHLFSLGPAKDRGGWHLPEDDTDMAYPNGKFSILCLRQHQSKLKPNYSYPAHSTNLKNSNKSKLTKTNMNQ